jgi:hypothetical protein
MTSVHGNTYSIDRYRTDSTNANVEYQYHSTAESIQAHIGSMSQQLDSFKVNFYTER